MSKKNGINWVSSDAPPKEQVEYSNLKDKAERKAAKKARIKKAFKKISDVILWVCAVGGFVLGIISAVNN